MNKVTVNMSGVDGNAFAIIGHVSKAMRKGGVSPEKIKEFTDEVFAADSYDHMLRIVMSHVTVTMDDEEEFAA